MDRRSPRLVLVVLLVLASVVWPATAGLAADSVRRAAASDGVPSAVVTAADAEIVRDITLSLTPETPGEIRVTVGYEMPGNVQSLTTSVPAEATVRSTRGFEKTGTDTYEWTDDRAPPRLTFTVPANETRPVRTTSGRPGDGEYTFVDVGEWALVRVPQFGAKWSWTGSGDVTLRSEVTVDGPGATGGSIAYLGPHRSFTRTANGQTFHLAVPAAASMNESPSAVLDSLAAASRSLRWDARDDRVFFVAAPTTVAWNVQGVQYGEADAWVRADAPVADADNVWLHEYVHTRQTFVPTAETQWLVEASADYYAARVALDGGYVDYPAFRADLAVGTTDPYADGVLDDPSTWVAGTSYYKGALVLAAVDRRIRLATGGDRSLDAVFRRLNRREEPVDEAAFLDAVGAVATPEVRAFAERVVASPSTPDLWSKDAHQKAFGTLPASMAYEVVPPDAPTRLRVAGPYRDVNVSVDGDTVALATGERLVVPAAVHNVGGETGRYDAALRVNGTVVASATGRLSPGERTTTALAHRFANPGTYNVSVGGDSVRVRVRDPAAPVVIGVTVGTVTPATGDAVAVNVTLGNDAGVPARGPVTATADGEAVATWNVSVAPDGRATRNVTVRFGSPGDHELRVGNRSVTVSVHEPSTSAATDSDTETTAVGQPGFGVGVALAALAALSAALALTTGLPRRRR